MAEEELYSIESVVDALMRTGAASAHAQDEPEAVRAVLLQLMELLKAKCGIFYPTANSVMASQSPVRIHSAATGEPHVPSQLSAEMEGFIFESLQQVATSQDPAFNREHLKKLPATTASSSSIWAGVTSGETRFGVIALFDPAARKFGGMEQKLVRTIAIQMGQGLAAIQTRKQAPVAGVAVTEKIPENVVDGFIEFSRIMNGVSRELINPLTAVLGYLELLKSEPQSERSLHYLQKLQDQTEKTQAVISTLNSSPQSPNLRPNSAITKLISPAPDASATASASVVVYSAPETHSRILLVQKSEAVMEFQKSVLSTVGAEAVCTFAGWEAISVLTSSDVDAVILDDELEGEWTASKLYAWICEHKPEISKRVLLTVSPRPTAEVREWVDGCDIPHVMKPLHIVDLFSGVQQILGLGGAKPASKFLH